MLSLKPQIPADENTIDYERQLEHLYARRSAIDALIQSLEDYDRFRETQAAAPSPRKTA